MSATGKHVLGWAVCILALSGCAANEFCARQLQSADPLERARGCKRAGGSGDPALVPLLVDRLEDRDQGVRFYAAQALRELTGKDFHYRESDPPQARAEAVRRWREYANSSAGSGRQ